MVTRRRLETNESSSPLSCGCSLCIAWRKERGIERVPAEQMPKEPALPLGEPEGPTP